MQYNVEGNYRSWKSILDIMYPGAPHDMGILLLQLIVDN